MLFDEEGPGTVQKGLGPAGHSVSVGLAQVWEAAPQGGNFSREFFTEPKAAVVQLS